MVKPIALGKPKRKLPDKIGAVKDVRTASGDVIFTGTERQWQKWARKHRTPFLTSGRRIHR